MNERDLQQRAVDDVRKVLTDAPPEPKLIHCESETEWNESLLRTLSEHKIHVLGRGADIVVFFDESGKEIGWRDDGRLGAEQPEKSDPLLLRDLVINELGLPRTTVLGSAAPKLLPPLGWTHEVILFTTPQASKDGMVRAWVSPGSNHVIQCLYGPPRGPGSGA